MYCISLVIVYEQKNVLNGHVDLGWGHSHFTGGPHPEEDRISNHLRRLFRDSNRLCDPIVVPISFHPISHKVEIEGTPTSLVD